MSNSNHSTGPLLSSSSTSTTGGDHKMVPAAIGSERKRHMPPSVHSSTGDRSSMSKREIFCDQFVLNHSLCSRVISLFPTAAATTTTSTADARLSEIGRDKTKLVFFYEYTFHISVSLHQLLSISMRSSSVSSSSTSSVTDRLYFTQFY
jgi:hypothetical protein